MVYKCISWYIMVYNGILYVSNTFKYSTPILWDPNSCIVRNILMFIWGDWMLGGRDSQTLQTGFWNMRNIYCIIIYHHQERRDIPRTKKQWMYHQQHPKTAAPHTFGHVSIHGLDPRSTRPSPWCGPSIAPTPGISMDSMPSLVRKSMTLGM